MTNIVKFRSNIDKYHEDRLEYLLPYLKNRGVILLTVDDRGNVDYIYDGISLADAFAAIEDFKFRELSAMLTGEEEE